MTDLTETMAPRWTWREIRRALLMTSLSHTTINKISEEVRLELVQTRDDEELRKELTDALSAPTRTPSTPQNDASED